VDQLVLLEHAHDHLNHDDIDSLAVDLYNFLVDDMGLELGDDDDFNAMLSLLYNKLDPFITRNRNFNV
jgi:hypothetical protein